jgi:DHA1 family multidrug resistance protein-like MFS transporter
MQRWKINLTVLWIGNFLVMAGMTMITPFLSLYLKQDLGLTNDHEIGVWAGLIFAANFVTSFLFQPLWGKLSDRYGRKIMLLRSGFGMAVVMAAMGFAATPWHLLLLRMANGVISGFSPAAVSLVSASTPKERMGFAMGTLQSGGTAGVILGPFLGGLMADSFGFRPIFFITGSLMFLASVFSWIMVKENFDRTAAARAPQASIISGFRELIGIRQIPVLLTVTLLIQFAFLSTMPLIPLYVEKLHGSMENLAFWSGFVGSVTALSNMIFSPLLGRLGDRIGATKILMVSLAGSAVMFVPQAFAGSVGELLVYRFLLGCFMGGLIPTVNALLRKYTPDGMESRAFSFNGSAISLGNMMGPIMGGALSGFIGIEGLFLMSAVMLMATGVWFYFTTAKAKPS